MKITPNSLGKLVRPRKIDSCKILNPNQGIDLNSFVNNYDSVTFSPTTQILDNVKNIYIDLSLGDTKKDLGNCYVAQITHFIVSTRYQNFVLVDKNNLQEVKKTLQTYFKSSNLFPVHYVGVQFFKGMQQTKNNKLIPIDPWQFSNENKIWFFRSYELLEIDQIINFENIEDGDLLFFKRSKGFVVNTKTRKKPNFCLTNSWSCRTVSLLLDTKKILNLYPKRIFKIYR